MITDHRNGSWTVTGYKDKKYLLSLLKKEGNRPHVHRKGDNRWTIGLTKDLAYTPKVRIQKLSRESHRKVGYQYSPRAYSRNTLIGGRYGRYIPLGRTRRYPTARTHRGFSGYSGGLGLQIPSRRGPPFSFSNLAKRYAEYKTERQKALKNSEAAKRAAALDQKGTISISNQIDAYRSGGTARPSDESFEAENTRKRLEQAKRESDISRTRGQERAIKEKEIGKRLEQAKISRFRGQIAAAQEQASREKETAIDQSALQQERQDSVT